MHLINYVLIYGGNITISSILYEHPINCDLWSKKVKTYILGGRKGSYTANIVEINDSNVLFMRGCLQISC